MRFLIAALALLVGMCAASAQTLQPGTYTAVVSPNGVTFTPVTACTWQSAPNSTPACPNGGTQSGGTWQHGECPAWQYVGGTCAVASTWRPLTSPASAPIMAKPAKGSTWTTPYGLQQVRATDHAADIPGSDRFRNDYSRREPWNADGTLFVGDQSSGYWGLYDARTWTYLRRLNGPAGDAEIQWDAADPRILYYLPSNGGTMLRRLDVVTNMSTVQYDFGADVRAIFGSSAARCWTKSEGSPSRDGKLWGLMCQTNSFGMLGYAVLDVQAKRVVWSMRTTALPDHVSMSPSGRWFVRSGDDSLGTVAYAIDGSGRTVQLHHKSEHSDLGVLPGGHDFYASVDYQTNEGDLFAIDIDAGAGSRKVIGHAYHDAANPGTYSMHFSAKAFDAPGWVVVSLYGAPSGPANLAIVNVMTGATYGVGLNYPPWSSYWDEPHAVANRNLSSIAVNGTFGQSANVDVYVVRLGALPN